MRDGHQLDACIRIKKKSELFVAGPLGTKVSYIEVE